MISVDATVDKLQHQLAQLISDPSQLWQLGGLALAFGCAWLVRWRFDRWERAHPQLRDALWHSAIEKTIAPVTLGVVVWIAAATIEALGGTHSILRVTQLLAWSLAIIRLVVFALERMLKPGPLLTASERAIAWTIWLVVALYLLGWIDPIKHALRTVYLPFGVREFSLLDAARAIVALLVSLLFAGYLGVVIERRVMGAVNVSPGIKVGVVKFAKLGLMIVAGIVAIDSSGIDMTALQVFGGALGVGLGFGMQRIASNFVSGFILIGDRSIRQGDVITIGTRFGIVTELRARYVVVRDRDNVDTLIPNETLISSEVINWSYGDRNVRLKLPIQISYDDNPRQAMEIITRAAVEHPRVLDYPAPVARIMDFGDNGVDLELRFWIDDPEDGVMNVRSDLYLSVWDAFKEAGISIPFPQRDLHLRSGFAPPAMEKAAASDATDKRNPSTSSG